MSQSYLNLKSQVNIWDINFFQNIKLLIPIILKLLYSYCRNSLQYLNYLKFFFNFKNLDKYKKGDFPIIPPLYTLKHKLRSKKKYLSTPPILLARRWPLLYVSVLFTSRLFSIILQYIYIFCPRKGVVLDTVCCNLLHSLNILRTLSIFPSNNISSYFILLNGCTVFHYMNLS